jgi:hypothetical protein
MTFFFSHSFFQLIISDDILLEILEHVKDVVKHWIYTIPPGYFAEPLLSIFLEEV